MFLLFQMDCVEQSEHNISSDNIGGSQDQAPILEEHLKWKAQSRIYFS